MFKVPKDYTLAQQTRLAEKNYVIQKNDYLKVMIYTNGGERIVDPNFELLKDSPASSSLMRNEVSYLVDLNGIAKFPLIGDLKVESLTIRQAEEILQKEYTKYYQEPFVVLNYLNKRVIVLGEPGGQVVPLVNENVKLTEVLALAKGIQMNAKAHNIRVLRGDQVFLADFSTVDSYLKTNMIVEPGDVIYVEPIRRPALEALSDYVPFISIITSLSTLVIILVK
jgi:polysaccharide export outer membrane protein